MAHELHLVAGGDLGELSRAEAHHRDVEGLSGLRSGRDRSAGTEVAEGVVAGYFFCASARSRLNAALIKATWVNACGKFPSASPLVPISSEYSPTWLSYPSMRSKSSRASLSLVRSTRPALVNASTSQNVHILKVPSFP